VPYSLVKNQRAVMEINNMRQNRFILQCPSDCHYGKLVSDFFSCLG
jgi:hypothetical protein